MKKITLSTLTLAILMSAPVLQAETLTVTSQGKVVNQLDITGKVPSEWYLIIGGHFGYFIPWNGDDSLDYEFQDSTLIINGQLAGIGGDIDLSKLAHLEQLYSLNGTVSDFSQLTRCVNLRELSLSGQEIKFNDLSTLSEVPDLVTLRLYNCNGISDTVLMHISQNQNLKELLIMLSNNEEGNITSASVEPLAGMNNLRRLVLTSVDFTEEDEHNLHQALPDCHITISSPGTLVLLRSRTGGYPSTEDILDGFNERSVTFLKW